jgi:hypothetical protein
MTLGPAYAAGGGGLPDYVSIAHNAETEDITVVTTSATYQWTEVAQESDSSMFTLGGTVDADAIVFNETGIYKIEWTCLFAGSGSPAIPFWVMSFLERDPLGGGSFEDVSGGWADNGLSDDTTPSGQVKVSVSGMCVISMTATDELRLRVRRGDSAAVTVKTDGGSGNTLLITKIG